MSVRLAAFGLLLGAINLAWAAFLVALIRNGTASFGLAWLVPLPIAAGLYTWIGVGRRYLRERA